MKIWNEFGSSHSDNISIIGTFRDATQAQKASDLIEDLVFGSWEERYPSVEGFHENWKAQFSWVEYMVNQDDWETGIDNTPGFEIDGDQIRITDFRHAKIGGIMKALLYLGAINTEVKQG